MKNKGAAAGHPIGQPEQKYNILALFGKSGSGKDTFLTKITQLYSDIYHRVVAYTTRPPRDNEVEGKDYYFITAEEFAQKILDLSMIEATCFTTKQGPWVYGTNINSLDINKINIGIFNIQAIECLLSDSRLNVMPIMIYATDKKRLQRQLNREEDPDCFEICRRFISDEQDFEDIPFEYEIIPNEYDNLLTKQIHEIKRFGQINSIFYK